MPRSRWLAVLAALVVGDVAPAAVRKPLPLKDVIAQEEVIVLVAVEAVDPKGPSVTFKVAEHLKAKPPAERLTLGMTGDAEAVKLKQVPALLDRLVVGRTGVLFLSKEGARTSGFAFVEGAWFQFQGTPDGETTRWSLLHGEPYLRRTFAGTTEGLKAVLTGKAAAPPWNEKEPPGYGPPPEKSGATPPQARVAGSTLFAVIPSFVLVGPLALLAVLFPGVTARLAVTLSAWRALLVTASLTTSVALGDYWLRQAGWPAPRGLALCTLGVTVTALFWSGWRYRRRGRLDAVVTAAPSRRDVLALVAVTLGVVAGLTALGAWTGGAALCGSPWREFTAVGVGLTVASFYITYRRMTQVPTAGVQLSLSGETVALAGVLAFGLALVCWGVPGSGVPPDVAVTGDASSSPGLVRFLRAKILWQTDEADEVLSGVTVADGKLYFGTAKTTGFRQSGALYALDAGGRELWKFTDGARLKPVFARPAVHGGTVYCGEGLHADNFRRLFALDATTGRPAWPQPLTTTSHTEGTPLVRAGRVTFPAGDDGVYCLDARTGATRWHLGGGETTKLHIDTPPATLGDAVFVGSGYRTRCLLALNATTGEELWRTPVTLRSFGPPLVVHDAVIFGLGTGNLTEGLSHEPGEDGPPETTPGGAIVCLDAVTGRLRWQIDTPSPVHTPLCADRRAVYATSQGGTLTAIDIETGRLRWARPCGPSFTSGPVVATYAAGALSLAVYAVTTDGAVHALDPTHGQVLWKRPLAQELGQQVQVFSTAVLDVGESERRLTFGAMLTSPATGSRSVAILTVEDTTDR